MKNDFMFIFIYFYFNCVHLSFVNAVEISESVEVSESLLSNWFGIKFSFKSEHDVGLNMEIHA